MKDLFKSLGVSERGMNTYLRLLELGAQPASVIARHMKIPRSTMYLVLEGLEKCGLVEEFERAKVKFFKCISPRDIDNLLTLKEREVLVAKDLLTKNLSKLEVYENKLSITPSVRFYEGKDAISRMYESILNEGPFYSFSNFESVGNVLPVYITEVAQMIKKKKLKVKELLVSSVIAKKYAVKYKSSFHQIKLLPRGASFDADTIIGKDRMYMISYGEKDVSAVEIYNPSLAKTQRVMFEQVWGK